MKPATRLNHPPAVGVPSDNRPLVAPIYQSVKFTFDDVEQAALHSRGGREGFQYSRISNPTLRQLELTLAELQGRDACKIGRASCRERGGGTGIDRAQQRHGTTRATCEM